MRPEGAAGDFWGKQCAVNAAWGYRAAFCLGAEDEIEAWKWGGRIVLMGGWT